MSVQLVLRLISGRQEGVGVKNEKAKEREKEREREGERGREETKAEERKSSALGVVGLSAGELSLSLARLKPYPLLIYQINQHSYLCTCEEIQPLPEPSKSPFQSVNRFLRFTV